MDDLVQWLRAQLDEDERTAQAADAELSTVFTRIASFDPEMAADERHIMAHRPARVLREIDAKREVLAFVERRLQESTERDFLVRDPAKMILSAVDPVVRYLATAYADRPGYRDEWRPKPE
ncbi:DUF6221 family protein [Streptomyces mutabilis]|uniref:DUF6221 family protein n=1 Tax=Streptomyces mutabilis TaxID=67332 RepID=UPI00365DA631